MLSNFGKRLPQAVQGLAVPTIGLRAMSAEAAIAEEQLEAELEIAIAKAHATSDLGKRHGFMLDAWDKTVAILANRGIDLDPSVKSSVVRQILSSTP